MRPQILLVDDHEIVRKGIRQLVEGPTREVCGEAATGTEAIAKAAELKPDLAIMDYWMSDMNGVEAMQKIREVSPGTKIVILTMDDEAVKSARDAGADACVHKAAVVSELHQAIAKLVLGRKLEDGW